MKKWIIIVVVALAVIAVALYFAFAGSQQQAGPSTAVRVETVVKGKLTEVVAAPGEVQPITKVSISARTSARILALPYDEGDTVTKGDEKANPPVPASVLVRLDDSDLRAVLTATRARRNGQAAQIVVQEQRLKSQESTLDAQRVEVEDAERELRRNSKLYESRDVSSQVVDQLRARYDQLVSRYRGAAESLAAERASLAVLRYQVEAADAEIAQAQEQLNYTTITSPIDGTVTKMNAKEGELVVTGTMNNAGTVLMEVADLSKLQVNVRLDQSNVVQVKTGQKARVRLQAFEDETFTGVVRSVGLDLESDVRTQRQGGNEYYEAEILLDDPGRRLPVGLKADAEIEIFTHEDVIRVPSQAVLPATVDELPEAMRTLPEVDLEKTVTPVVYVMEYGKAVCRPVRIGSSDLTHTIILSGLKEEDKVIVGPYKALVTIKHETPLSLLTAQDPTSRPTTQAATRPTTAPTTAPSN